MCFDSYQASCDELFGQLYWFSNTALRDSSNGDAAYYPSVPELRLGKVTSLYMPLVGI
jgi:hypothetical protein